VRQPLDPGPARRARDPGGRFHVHRTERLAFALDDSYWRVISTGRRNTLS
jgi:hypothetical protein